MTIQEFAERVQTETLERFIKDAKHGGFPSGVDYVMGLHGDSAIKTRVIPGKKYTKVDVGSSGRFMIDADGNIFGIKAYGVIHFGHNYGTLDTVDQYRWGWYSPVKK